jgi:carboxymethylenebutenolidase
MRMWTKAVLAAALVGFFLPGATLRADSPKTETVQFPNGKETLSAYVSVPDKPGRFPGIIVIHSWLGLDDWTKSQADKIAQEGFVAMAIDLYHGKVPKDLDEAQELMSGQPAEHSVTDMIAAYNYLITRKDVDRDRVGTIGWGMGGTYALQLAMHNPRIGAVVVNYGTPPTDPNDIQTMFAQVLGNFGGADRGTTPADVASFEKVLKNLGRTVDVKIYDGVGNGFENPNNTKTYDEEAAADAWARTIKFLNKALK